MYFGSTGALIFVLPNLMLSRATQITSNSTVICGYQICTAHLKLLQFMKLASIALVHKLKLKNLGLTALL